MHNTRRQVQKMDGWTESQTDAELRHSNLICSTVKQSHMKNFSSICQSMKEKSAENCTFLIFQVQKEA